MDKEIYQKNMQALTKKFPVWAYDIHNIKRKKRGFDVMREESLDGEPILKVSQNGKVRYLNGKYAPSAVVERWLSRQGKITEFAPIVVIGISNGAHIRRIMEEAPKTTNILIYEPSLELFRRELEEVDLSFLFAPDIPVGIVVEGLNETETETFFRHMISYDNMTSLKYYLSGNYKELFPEEVGEFVTLLKKYVSETGVTWNTLLRYTNVKTANVFMNLHDLYEGYSIETLKGILPSDVPTIVVAAGPSLNKNIQDLKKAQGKACIIATDTAMKPLLNAGIMPHLFVVIDGLKPAKLFEHKQISRVPMVTMTGVSAQSMAIHHGKKFFYYSDNRFEHQILIDLGNETGDNRTLPNLTSGGSVATSAYSLGVYMGSKTVILVGQDLALTGNKTHADGTFQEKMEEVDITKGRYIEVEAIGGGKVYTRDDFRLYLDWYEDIIKRWPSIQLVDATEGGALIHGSKVMTLKNAIRKYCKREFNVKWHIDHQKKIVPEEQKEFFLNRLLDSEGKLKEVERKSREGLRQYEKLEQLAKKPGASEKEINKLLRRLKKTNQYMSTDYMALTVSDSLLGLEYILRPSIYQTKDTKSEELADIAEQGKTLTYAMVVAAREIRDFAGKTIVPFAKEHLEAENKSPNERENRASDKGKQKEPDE